MSSCDLAFLPWARAGASAALTPASVHSGHNRPEIDVGLTLKATPSASAPTNTTVPTVSLPMLGPGDVVGVAGGEVIRTEPADGATGVETELFVAVELGDPSLPWLFTPAVENAQHQLRPWLCLVVVREQDGVSLDTGAGTLTIASPADPAVELPNLADAWAWAHVQYNGALPAGLSAATAGQALVASQSAAISRLLSPRRLAPNTRYLACVVPTYAAGVQAGRGGQPKPDELLADGWQGGSSSPITLPVYHHFSFSTGEGGDFLSLAQAVAHPPGLSRTRTDGLGGRVLDLTHAGFAWPATGGQPAPASLPLPGVLRPANETDSSVPPQLAAGLQGQLTPSGTLPQLRPPLYGGVQAGVRRADLAPGGPLLPMWLTELNFDPRLRVAAALGAQVVASEQENLSTAAWQQVEQTYEVNALLSRAQLARIVSRNQSDKHLSTKDPLLMLQLTSPQATRMQVNVADQSGSRSGSPWAFARTADDPRLAAVLSAPYRRLSRPRGPFWRRVAAPTAPATPVTAQQVMDALAPGVAVQERVLAERLSPLARAAAIAGPGQDGRPRTPGQDPLAELSAPVTFPAGMALPLIRLAPDAMLAGAGAIPPNTALSLATNPAVIVAYLIGANYEIARELQWRGVPTNRRASPFRWFWDVRGQGRATRPGTGGQAEPIPDLPNQIADWTPGSNLASQLSGGGQLVLAVRADLFRRYPQTAVYAVRAVQSGSSHTLADESNPANVQPPQFTVTLPPDIRLFGFDIPPADAIGGPSTPGHPGTPGWFFVLQEQVSETRFGREPSAGAEGYWGLADLGVAANSHSAGIAEAVRLPPVRCAIHARALLPASTSSGAQ